MNDPFPAESLYVSGLNRAGSPETFCLALLRGQCATSYRQSVAEQHVMLELHTACLEAQTSCGLS